MPLSVAGGSFMPLVVILFRNEQRQVVAVKEVKISSAEKIITGFTAPTGGPAPVTPFPGAVTIQDAFLTKYANDLIQGSPKLTDSEKQAALLLVQKHFEQGVPYYAGLEELAKILKDESPVLPPKIQRLIDP